MSFHTIDSTKIYNVSIAHPSVSYKIIVNICTNHVTRTLLTNTVSGPEVEHATPFPPPHLSTSPNDVTHEDTWPPPETPRDPSSSEREYNVITHEDHIPRHTSGSGGVLRMAEVSTLSPDGALASSTLSSDSSTGDTTVRSERQSGLLNRDLVSVSTNSRPETPTQRKPEVEGQPSGTTPCPHHHQPFICLP